jgi:LDH2 family malate/lactate/ureidoglycolate dehydrogenase
MVEILCAVLSGGAMLTNVGGIRIQNVRMNASQMFLAVEVARFMPLDEFVARMQFIRDTVHSARPAAGFEEVMIAGDPEWRTEERRLRDGIPVSNGIWQQLSTLAARLGVEIPRGAL